LTAFFLSRDSIRLAFFPIIVEKFTMASTKTHKVHYSTISSISSIKKYIFKGSPIKLVGILLFFVSSTVMGGDTLSFLTSTMRHPKNFSKTFHQKEVRLICVF